MKRFRNVLTALMVLMAALSLASCSSTGEAAAPVDAVDGATTAVATTDAQASADDQMRAIFGISDEDVDVATYRIRGEGADGASFDWVEVTEPRVAIAGVRRGEWTIYAQALNEDGDVIVSGRLDTFLSSDAPTDNLVFEEVDGVGDVRTEITWNTSQVQDPSIEVYVKKDGGQFVPRDPAEVTFGEDGTAVWQATGLDAGSYVARFVFKDAGTVVGGSAAALRVISGYTSVGSVSMTVGDMTSEYSISLDNTPADVTLGTLHHDDGVLFFAPADGGDGYSYEWYVDGEPVDGVTSQTLDLETLGLADGVYRVDVVVDNGSYGSMNSYSLVVLLEAQSVYSTIGADEVCHISPILIEDEPAVADVVDEAVTEVTIVEEPVAEAPAVEVVPAQETVEV